MGKAKAKSKPGKKPAGLGLSRKAIPQAGVDTPEIDSQHPISTSTNQTSKTKSTKNLTVSPAVTRSSMKRSRSNSLSVSGSSTESLSLLSGVPSHNCISESRHETAMAAAYNKANSSSPTIDVPVPKPNIHDADRSGNSTLVEAQENEMCVDEDEDFNALNDSGLNTKKVAKPRKTSLFLLDSSDELIKLERTPPRPAVQRKCSPLLTSGTSKQSQKPKVLATNLELEFDDLNDESEVLEVGQDLDSNNSMSLSLPVTPTSASPPSGINQDRECESDDSSFSASPSSWNLNKKPDFKLSDKMALYFVYLGHREEEITTTTKPVEKRFSVSCKLCPATRGTLAGHDSSNSNLYRHLRGCHGICLGIPSLSSDSSPVAIQDNSFYTKSHPKQKKYEMNCVRFTVLNNLPFQMARWDAFQMLVQDLDPCVRPMCGKTMSRRMEDCSIKATEDLKQFFTKIPYVSLVVDGWSTKKNKGVIAVMAMYVTRNFVWGIKTLSLRELASRHTGTALRDCLDDILGDLGLQDKVTSIVIDNGSNMVAAYDTSSKPRKPFCHEIPRPLGTRHVTYRCAAHTLQLVVKNANLGHIGVSVRKAMVCIMKCLNSHVLRKLLLLQTGRGFPKKSETRWNAEFDIIFLLLTPKMFNAVNYIMDYALNTKNGSFFKNSEVKPEPLSKNDHKNLKEYCSLFGPLAEATDKLQADGVTAGIILPVLLETYQKLLAVKVRSDTENSVDVKAGVINAFVSRFAAWFSDPMLVAATLLDPWRKLYFFEYMRTKEYDHELPLMSDSDAIAEIEQFCNATAIAFFGINATEMEELFPEDPEHSPVSPVSTLKPKTENLNGYASMNISGEACPSPSSENTNSENRAVPLSAPSPISSPAKDFQKIIALEIRVYLLEPVLNEDIVSYWQRKAHVFPMLSHLFRVIMSRPATTAAVERLFSKCGIITRDKRCNISPTTLHKLLLVREWFELRDELKLRKPADTDDSDSISSPGSASESGEDSIECLFDIDVPTITQSPSTRKQSPGKRTSASQSDEELLDFETALSMVLEGSFEDDEQEDVDEWENFESQAMGWAD